MDLEYQTVVTCKCDPKDVSDDDWFCPFECQYCHQPYYEIEHECGTLYKQDRCCCDKLSITYVHYEIERHTIQASPWKRNKD